MLTIHGNEETKLFLKAPGKAIFCKHNTSGLRNALCLKTHTVGTSKQILTPTCCADLERLTMAGLGARAPRRDGGTEPLQAHAMPDSGVVNGCTDSND